MKNIKLQTEIPLKPEANQIDYASKILLLGSCFSVNIGEKFEYYKFQNTINPFGIIFNPVSLEKLIFRAIEQEFFTEADVFENRGRWFCFETHSEISSETQDEILVKLNLALKTLQESLLDATHIILTHGTSWVYRHLETNAIVANCHKLPQRLFQKELLSVDDISLTMGNIKEKIFSLNPDVKIINTISPVRHIKDGFVENTQSKAHLISAIHSILNKHHYYFPSFEIMMDELRDYRFYEEDMLHPNKTAIEIIWQKFSSVWISASIKKTQEDVVKIQTSLHHRALNSKSSEHLIFLERLQEKIIALQKDFPHISF